MTIRLGIAVPIVSKMTRHIGSHDKVIAIAAAIIGLKQPLHTDFAGGAPLVDRTPTGA